MDETPIVKRWHRVGPRPTWRGKIHLGAAIVTLPFIVAFVVHSAPGWPRIGATVFSTSAALLFATSATYHLGDWSDRWLLWMKRADHIAIFVLSAGTYTGVCVTLFEGVERTVVLLLSWLAVVAGTVAASLGAFEKRGWANTSYITLGWLAVLISPRLVDRLTVTELVLLVAGGVLYTVGAIALAMRRPDPWPATFGYHEVWHVLTVIAVVSHGTVVWSLTT